MGIRTPCACANETVSNDPHTRIGSQDSFQASRHSRRAIGDDDHAGMLRIADADSAAVVDRHPGGARGGVHQRVQQRPVGDGVRTVAHGLRLPERRGDGARVKVIAADHDRRAELALLHIVVHGAAKSGAFAIAEPADPRGQPLKVDLSFRQIHPPAENPVIREQLAGQPVGGADVFGVARQRHPAERPLTLAE